jgi:hypothetical protein
LIIVLMEPPSDIGQADELKRREEHGSPSRFGCVQLLPVLSVVLLTVDIAAFVVQLSVKASALAWGNIPIGFREFLIYLDPCKTRFCSPGFTPG